MYVLNVINIQWSKNDEDWTEELEKKLPTRFQIILK